MKVLTSWKEIAQYFNKGVRTVQRWEADFGLPVRRAHNSEHRAVLAIPEELDYWLLSNTNTSVDTRTGRPNEADLRQEVMRLRAENAKLRLLLRGIETDSRQLPFFAEDCKASIKGADFADMKNGREAAAA